MPPSLHFIHECVKLCTSTLTRGFWVIQNCFCIKYADSFMLLVEWWRTISRMHVPSLEWMIYYITFFLWMRRKLCGFSKHSVEYLHCIGHVSNPDFSIFHSFTFFVLIWAECSPALEKLGCQKFWIHLIIQTTIKGEYFIHELFRNQTVYITNTHHSDTKEERDKYCLFIFPKSK